MFKTTLFLSLCICILAVLSVPAKGEVIEVKNMDPNNAWTLSDLIVYGDPNEPSEVLIIKKPGFAGDDVVIPAGGSQIFYFNFPLNFEAEVKSYIISAAQINIDEDVSYNEWETKVFNVRRVVPKKIAMIDIGPYIQEQLRATLEIDQSVPSEPPPEGTILAFVDGRNELVPGWFVGTDINFETGDVTGAYTGNVEVSAIPFDVLVFTPPYPPDGATDVPLSADIFWTKSDHTDHFEVFFGTDFSDMKTMFKGEQGSNYSSYDPGTLEPCTTYYWKINDVCIEYVEVQYGEFTVIEEQVYVLESPLRSFTTGFLKATNPYPADFSINVEPNTRLSWTPGCGAVSHGVYLGDSFDAVANAEPNDISGIYRGLQEPNSYVPTVSPLEPGQSYFWRIDGIQGPEITSKGSIWRFTTKTDECAPTQEELTPPPAPSGYEYVGYDVVVNFVLTETTIPLDYTESPDDIRYIRSRTIVEGGVTVCDIIVSFLFRKIEECGPTPEELTPPSTPEGYEYVGYDVVVNFVLTDSTIPLDYSESPEDISVIRSHTIVRDGQTICDVVVRHLFRKK